MDADRLARSFDSAAAEYERGRPGYPRAAIDRLEGELALGPLSTVVDLAAGTGKLTRDLVPRFEAVIAVEPLDGMLAQLRNSTPGAHAVAGSAEAIPLPDGFADAVFVAQAFHWFDGETALAEIARVLRSGGGLGLLWNSTPWETRESPWFAAVDDLLNASRADLSTLHRHASGAWLQAFRRADRFEPLQSASFRHEQRLSREDFGAALASRSYVASLPAADREELLGAVSTLLESSDAPLEDGEVILPLTTNAFWTKLIA